MHCPACGTPNAESANYCSNCQTPLSAQSDPAEAITPSDAPDATPTATPRTSGLAIASLILGILGFFCVGLVTGPIGIILGLVALHKIRARPHLLKGKGLATAGAITSSISILVSLLLLLLIAILMPALSRARGLAQSVACAAQLQGLGTAVTMYQLDNNDQFPPDLQALVDAEYASENILICPALHNSPDQVHYIYRGAGLTGDIPGQLIIIYEPATNHTHGEQNVLFADSSVQRVTDDKFSVLMQQDLELRREQGLPELPFE